MTKNTRIIVDMDCILTDMFAPMFEIIREVHGIDAGIKDLTNWDMGQCPPLDQVAKFVYGIFRRPGFFRNLKPLPGALEGFRTLYEAGNELVIVSTPSGPQSAAEKYEWLAQYLPYLSDKDVFMGAHKFMVKADVIIDDRGETLERYRQEWPVALCLGIGYPYNEYVKSDPGIRLCGSYTDTASAWREIIRNIQGD